jgi:hypothetical protein
MLLKRAALEAIRDGRVSLVFRKWRRPTVKAGGRLKTAIGLLAIERVDPVSRVTDADAKRAGYASRAALLRDLDQVPEGPIYRIALRFDGADPRIALRQAKATADEWHVLEQKLLRMDARTTGGSWVTATLDIIARRPATRAEALATELGFEKDVFKPRVRRLKELGLTESLEVGYRLSPRGEDALERLRDQDALKRSR